MKNIITIGEKKYTLFCSTEAYSRIGAVCGGNTDSISDIFSPEKHSTGEIVAKFAEIAEILINGEIKRRNYAVELGFEDGEKEKLLPAGTVAALVHPTDIVRSKAAILNAIAGSVIYEVPDGVKLTKREVDQDLEEIREMKAKNGEGAE